MRQYSDAAGFHETKKRKRKTRSTEEKGMPGDLQGSLACPYFLRLKHSEDQAFKMPSERGISAFTKSDKTDKSR